MTTDLKASAQTNHCMNAGKGTPGSNLNKTWREDGPKGTELHVDDEKGAQRSQVVAFCKRDGSFHKTVAQQRQGSLFISKEIAKQPRSIKIPRFHGSITSLIQSSSSSSLSFVSAILNQTY